jgi:hypothetical protein
MKVTQGSFQKEFHYSRYFYDPKLEQLQEQD